MPLRFLAFDIYTRTEDSGFSEPCGGQFPAFGDQWHTMPMPRPIVAIMTLLSVCSALPTTALAAPIVATDSLIVFASREQAMTILGSEDAYTARMSPFDRMLRMKATAPVAQAQFLERMAANALDWNDTERQRITPLLQRLADALAGYRLPLPPQVLLIKTTGDVEIGDGYTRANAIVLPQSSLGVSDATLYFLVAHELFHVMTRHDAHFRALAYAQIGFRIGPEVHLPDAIAPLQITNPDAPRHDSFIDVRAGGRTMTVVPILLSRSAVFDPEIGNALDRYWSLRLLAIAQTSSTTRASPQMRNGAPVLLRLNEVKGFIEQIGANTRYIIHPEEILAENFALLVTGADVAEPQRIEALRRLLQRYGEAAAPHRFADTGSTRATGRRFCLRRKPDETRSELQFGYSRESPYLSANNAGWPPVCQNSTVSSRPKCPLRTRSMSPAAALPVYTGSSSTPSVRANRAIASRSAAVTTP